MERETLVTGTSQWCGRHTPAQPGLCFLHNVRLYELHDAEILSTFGVQAIFYCPRFGCDAVDWDSVSSRPAVPDDVLKYRRWLITFAGSKIEPELERIVGEVFRNAIRLKVLFLKQRQMGERLGLFEGGKKI